MTPDKLKEAQLYIDFVKNNLQPLADHLKVSVEWLWQILVNQVRVEAIVWLVVLVALSVKGSVLIYIAFKAHKKAKFGSGYGTTTVLVHKKTGNEIESELDDWENRKQYKKVIRSNKTNIHGYITEWAGVAGVALLIISSIVAGVSMPKIVTGLVNPEYGALERIVDFAKNNAPSRKQ